MDSLSREASVGTWHCRGATEGLRCCSRQGDHEVSHDLGSWAADAETALQTSASAVSQGRLVGL